METANIRFSALRNSVIVSTAVLSCLCLLGYVVIRESALVWVGVASGATMLCAMSARETLPPTLPLLHRYNRLARAQFGSGSPLAALAMMDRDFTADDYEVLLLLDEFNVQKTASKAQISRIPIHSFSVCPINGPEFQRTCHICLECYAEGDSLRTLPCMHQYHANCIDQWLSRKAVCPVCKCSVLNI